MNVALIVPVGLPVSNVRSRRINRHPLFVPTLSNRAYLPAEMVSVQTMKTTKALGMICNGSRIVRNYPT
jgi:hypothetical protein